MLDDIVAAILDAPGPQWRQTVQEQIAELDRLVEGTTVDQRAAEHT